MKFIKSNRSEFFTWLGETFSFFPMTQHHGDKLLQLQPTLYLIKSLESLAQAGKKQQVTSKDFMNTSREVSTIQTRLLQWPPATS